MALTVDEIIAGLNELAGDDKEKAKELATTIRERAKPIAQHLINVGSALKKEETRAEIERLKGEVAELTTARDEATQALEASNAAKPDVAKIEADLREKYGKKIDELKKHIQQKDETLKGAIGKGGLAKFTRELIRLGVDPEYAQEVAANKYRDRISPKDDGALGVFQLGESIEYDGDEDTKIAALAADVRKQVQPRWILTNADSGAGVGAGGKSAAGPWSQYRQQVEAEQKAGQNNSLSGADRLAGKRPATTAGT